MGLEADDQAGRNKVAEGSTCSQGGMIEWEAQ